MLDPARRQARIDLADEHLRAENAHDLDAILATFGAAPSLVLNGETIGGHAGIRGLYAAFGFGGDGGLTDMSARVLHQHVADQTIAMELLLSGRHSGDWNGAPGSGRRFEVPACAVFTFDDHDRVASERVYFDQGLMLRQLGLGA